MIGTTAIYRRCFDGQIWSPATEVRTVNCQFTSLKVTVQRDSQFKMLNAVIFWGKHFTSSNYHSSDAEPVIENEENKKLETYVKGFATIDNLAVVNVEGTGMAGVPGTASAIFGAVKDVGANVIMISQ
ncbi:hypothetical protein L1987_57135 [Smallanthus sonchifolius]|uniref:Uncharacterized protein n=1 Tax=Smallanthus sonchifolius TaxID=185202 RepID=A0ACB9DCE6_9ASTR|nr:hypothetical protein L1987_57135 [Smallanthus sonchifolius]